MSMLMGPTTSNTTDNDRCTSLLQLADANRTILDKTPAGIEHKERQDEYLYSMHNAIQCVQMQCRNDIKQDQIQKVLDAKKDIEKMMLGLKALENPGKGMPIYDAQALKDIGHGIDRLYVQAIRKCSPQIFLMTVMPMIKNLEKSPNGLIDLNNKWLTFDQADHPVARYIISSNGYSADDLLAAKLMILMGAPIKDLEILFPQKAE